MTSFAARLQAGWRRKQQRTRELRARPVQLLLEGGSRYQGRPFVEWSSTPGRAWRAWLRALVGMRPLADAPRLSGASRPVEPDVCPHVCGSTVGMGVHPAGIPCVQWRECGLSRHYVPSAIAVEPNETALIVRGCSLCRRWVDRREQLTAG